MFVVFLTAIVATALYLFSGLDESSQKEAARALINDKYAGVLDGAEFSSLRGNGEFLRIERPQGPACVVSGIDSKGSATQLSMLGVVKTADCQPSDWLVTDSMLARHYGEGLIRDLGLQHRQILLQRQADGWSIELSRGYFDAETMTASAVDLASAINKLELSLAKSGLVKQTLADRRASLLRELKG
ncbi:hypothetical protein [Stenotrophomonas geniculata]|uniref:hypothetical protein n=1 Tax=Stenotrophomonas geniculata TaxID=86188 RepID=UPI002E790F9F|nr:hypothetical protein [Stenotrophomonas geniculata]